MCANTQSTTKRYNHLHLGYFLWTDVRYKKEYICFTCTRNARNPTFHLCVMEKLYMLCTCKPASPWYCRLQQRGIITKQYSTCYQLKRLVFPDLPAMKADDKNAARWQDLQDLTMEETRRVDGPGLVEATAPR